MLYTIIIKDNDQEKYTFGLHHLAVITGLAKLTRLFKSNLLPHFVLPTTRSARQYSQNLGKNPVSEICSGTAIFIVCILFLLAL